MKTRASHAKGVAKSTPKKHTGHFSPPQEAKEEDETRAEKADESRIALITLVDRAMRHLHEAFENLLEDLQDIQHLP